MCLRCVFYADYRLICGHIENIRDIIYVIYIKPIRKTIWPILSGYCKTYGPTDFRLRDPKMRLTSNLSIFILYKNLLIGYRKGVKINII